MTFCSRETILSASGGDIWWPESTKTSSKQKFVCKFDPLEKILILVLSFGFFRLVPRTVVASFQKKSFARIITSKQETVSQHCGVSKNYGLIVLVNVRVLNKQSRMLIAWQVDTTVSPCSSKPQFDFARSQTETECATVH